MVEKSFLSATWYRVAALRLRPRAHARFHRTYLRGQLWYVLQDRTSGRFHRFSPPAYLVVSLLDGRRTMQQVWDIASEKLGDDVLTQDEVIRLLGQLHAADVLFGDVPPDIGELADRGRRQRRRKLVMSMMNPLALRVPLFDPDEFLTATRLIARLVFSPLGAIGFLGVVFYGLVLAGQHWNALTENIADRVLAVEGLLLILLAYPIVKALHELGHAYAVKRWGGEVHEIGVMFLVFMPVPYVDASDCLAFPEKWRRALVGGAGILVEMFLAAIAMIVWVNAETGMVHAFAFTVMLIGGISTLLFNGNPLLRFDGYYVLCDLIALPNLGSRSNAYIGYLIQRYAFGVTSAQSPVTAPGEAPWMLGYAIASFVYRLFIMAVIVLLVGTQFFIVGVLIAIWAVVLMLGVPLAKQVRFLLSSPILRRKRGRAFAVTGGAVSLAAAMLLFIPLPHATLADGVIWVRGDASVHAGADGTVIMLRASPNAAVGSGTPLIELEDPALTARERVLVARVAELQAHYAMRDLSDPAEARITLEELRLARADLALARDRLAELVVRSRTEGTLVLRRPDDLLGRFVRKGELIGYVVRLEDPVIRAVVPENDADLILQRTRGLGVRTVSDRSQVHPARIERIAPGLEESVPNLALSTIGGGTIAFDPTDPARTRVLGRYLHLDLALESDEALTRIGERVTVRFVHDAEPIASRLYRALRQVFLRHFNV